MAKSGIPFLTQEAVVVPRQYLQSAGGAVTLRSTLDGVAIESKRERKLLRPRPRWKRLAQHDPLLSLVGTLEDDAPDVSRNKYTYLADAYSR